MSFTVWLTGLPSSGKTTIGDELAKKLDGVERLDGDIIRKEWAELGFTKEDRDKNIIRAAQLCKAMNDNGINVVASFISPYEETRQRIGADLLVYIKCPLEICIQRDKKGLYKKAIAGEIDNFTGISAPYEEPVNPDLVVNSDILPVEDSVKAIIDKLKEKRYI